MEAVGAGANVVAFVVLAAQLTKTVYTTFSSIKDGPTKLHTVAKDVLRLHETLELLKACPMVAHDASLPSLVMDCILDLKPVDDDIRRLRVTPGEQKIGRLWKRFKIFLDERKLDQIRTQVDAHTNALHIRLGILQSFSVYGISTDVRSLSRSMVDIGDKIDNYSNSHVSQITTMHQSLSSLQQSQGDALQGGLSSLESAIQNVESLGQSNADSMLTLLHELKDLVVNRNEPKDEKASKSDSHEASTSDDTLVSSITRLCGLIEEKNRVYNTDTDCDEQAEDILGDIEKMISSAQQQVEATNGQAKMRTDLRRFRQAFGQFELALNPDRNHINSHRPNSQWRHEYTTLRVGNLGTIGLMKGTRIRSASQNTDGDLGCFDSTDCKFTVSFLPNNRTQFNMLVASTIRQTCFGRTAHSISSLAVNRVLPGGSKVFEVVRRGQVQELQEMLRRGEASLRDHDEWGASLLLYSTRKPEMCRFLLENGADVDHLGGNAGVWDDRSRWKIALISVLDMRARDDREYSPSELRSIIESRQLLLEAGADPLLQLYSFDIPFFRDIMDHSTLESFQAFWNWARLQPLNIVNHSITDIFPEYNGYTPLLRTCLFVSDSSSVQKLLMLVKLGADIKMRDSRGKSCLHVAVESFSFPLRRPQIRSTYDFIRLLIQSGADVGARDDSGRTAFEWVYEHCHCHGHGHGHPAAIFSLMFGSFAGDLWDAAVHDCGYDIRNFRNDHQRRAKYSFFYTRQDFEKLWEGRELECPYWDDSPWPPDAPWQPFVDDTCESHKRMDCYREPYDNDDCLRCVGRRKWFYRVYTDDEWDDSETESSGSTESLDGEGSQTEKDSQSHVKYPLMREIPNARESDWYTDTNDESDSDTQSAQSSEEKEIAEDNHIVFTEDPVSSALYENPWQD